MGLLGKKLVLSVTNANNAFLGLRWVRKSKQSALGTHKSDLISTSQTHFGKKVHSI